MSKQHLTYFKVENFKKFETLELTDIGQFNLIVGDNNVGKTSLLEALLFDTSLHNILLNFHKTLLIKGLNITPAISYNSQGRITEISYPEVHFLDFLVGSSKEGPIKFYYRCQLDQEFLPNSIHVGTTPNYIDPDRYSLFEPVLPEPQGKYILFSVNVISLDDTDDVTIGLYDHLLNNKLEHHDIALIYTSMGVYDDLSKVYLDEVALSRSKKKELLNSLKVILPKVEDFEVRKINGRDHLMLGVEGYDDLRPVSVYGDSVIRTVQILLELSKSRGQRLMIDEIDTGIHYSRLNGFLKTIFQLAEIYDVQLFMTTHSRECQEAFAAVFEEKELEGYKDKARQISLLENTEGKIVASVRNFEQLQNALEIGFETRGGVKG